MSNSSDDQRASLPTPRHQIGSAGYGVTGPQYKVGGQIGRAVPDMAPMLDYKNPNWPSEVRKVLRKWIEAFESTLDPSHEVGARLVNFGQTVVFALQNIEFSAGPLLRFEGVTEDGSNVVLVQHINQLSVMLVKLKRNDSAREKRPIGFHSEAAIDGK